MHELEDYLTAEQAAPMVQTIESLKREIKNLTEYIPEAVLGMVLRSSRLRKESTKKSVKRVGKLWK